MVEEDGGDQGASEVQLQEAEKGSSLPWNTSRHVLLVGVLVMESRCGHRLVRYLFALSQGEERTWEDCKEDEARPCRIDQAS